MKRKFTRLFKMNAFIKSVWMWSVAFLIIACSVNAQSKSKAATINVATQTQVEPIEVLLFNYCVYDAFYARSIRSILEQNRTDLDIAEFWSGDVISLKKALMTADAVIVPYAAEFKSKNLNVFRKTFQEFVEAGGTVIFTGTHQYHALQVFDLFQVHGVEYKDKPEYTIKTDSDRLTVAVPDTFSSKNFAYPIAVYSPEFITVAEVSGSKSIGYVEKGKGKVIYAGIEFYYDEPATTRILLNALEEAFERQSDIAYERKLAEEKAKKALEPESTLDWKVYPNPYTGTAFAELNLTETTSVSLEVVAETGAKVSTMLNKQQLAAGSYTYTLPELPNGIYFLRYTCGQELIVKKIVKMFVP